MRWRGRVFVKALQVAAPSPRDARLDGFSASQKSKFRAVTRESIDHGISIVKASQLPNQVVVDAFVHGGRGANGEWSCAEVRAEAGGRKPGKVCRAIRANVMIIEVYRNNPCGVTQLEKKAGYQVEPIAPAQTPLRLCASEAFAISPSTVYIV